MLPQNAYLEEVCRIMREYNITLLRGDGIGPEVVAQTLSALSAAGSRFGFQFNYQSALLGGCAIDATGNPLPEETVTACKAGDAVLLGAVGGAKWDTLPGNIRPEAGLLGIRKALGLYANLRPAKIFPALVDASPLKLKNDALDIIVVRELTGGIYFGERGRGGEGEDAYAYDTEKYSVAEIERIARTAFDLAMKRGRRVCSVDKANVLESSRLWREVVCRIAAEYPEIELSHLYVDNCSMQLVYDPTQFDVILTNNIFGDILSDEASVITGSIGMLPSASLGDGGFGLYEPVHGSAPDIAGKDIANPLATILSAGMMLAYTLDEKEAAQCIELSVEKALTAARTADIACNDLPTVGCCRMGEIVCENILSL